MALSNAQTTQGNFSAAVHHPQTENKSTMSMATSALAAGACSVASDPGRLVQDTWSGPLETSSRRLKKLLFASSIACSHRFNNSTGMDQVCPLRDASGSS
jgi:hypothetical protein